MLIIFISDISVAQPPSNLYTNKTYTAECWYGSNNLGSHTSLRLGPCVVVASGLDPGHWFYVYTENRALGDIVLCKILSIACNA